MNCKLFTMTATHYRTNYLETLAIFDWAYVWMRHQMNNAARKKKTNCIFHRKWISPTHKELIRISCWHLFKQYDRFVAPIVCITFIFIESNNWIYLNVIFFCIDFLPLLWLSLIIDRDAIVQFISKQKLFPGNSLKCNFNLGVNRNDMCVLFKLFFSNNQLHSNE